MTRFTHSAGLAILLATVAASPASAHIDVLPTRAVQEEAVELTFRVPNERDLPTTRVRIDFPPQFQVYSFAPPPPGWRIAERTNPSGLTTGVVYSGGRIEVSQYADFTVLATPFDAGTAVFRSFQTYADGKTKPWTGPPEQPGQIVEETGVTEPGAAAAVTVLTPAEVAADTGASPTAASPAAVRTESGAGIWLGLIAIGLSLIACAVAGFLWTTRPMRLQADPVDDPHPEFP